MNSRVSSLPIYNQRKCFCSFSFLFLQQFVTRDLLYGLFMCFICSCLCLPLPFPHLLIFCRPMEGETVLPSRRERRCGCVCARTTVSHCFCGRLPFGCPWPRRGRLAAKDSARRASHRGLDTRSRRSAPTVGSHVGRTEDNAVWKGKNKGRKRVTGKRHTHTRARSRHTPTQSGYTA